MDEFLKKSFEEMAKAFQIMTDAVTLEYKVAHVKGLAGTVKRAQALCRLLVASAEDGVDYTSANTSSIIEGMKTVIKAAAAFSSAKHTHETLESVRKAMMDLEDF